MTEERSTVYEHIYPGKTYGNMRKIPEEMVVELSK